MVEIIFSIGIYPTLAAQLIFYVFIMTTLDVVIRPELQGYGGEFRCLDFTCSHQRGTRDDLSGPLPFGLLCYLVIFINY